MDVHSLTVVWHDNNEPVYSINFQPNKNGKTSERVATGGGDNNVRIWKIIENSDNEPTVKVEYLSTLGRHTQAVNAVRFDPKGEILATAGDDGNVLLWTLSESIVKEFGADPDEEVKESWVLRSTCKSSSSEIYDLAWSPDSRYIITGSTDNISRIYDSRTGLQLCQISEHNHYVQGVAWDPLGEYIATQSADRSIHIYTLKLDQQIGLQPSVFSKISRAELPTSVRVDTLDNIIDIIKPEEILVNAESTSRTSFQTSSSVAPSSATLHHKTRSLNFTTLKSSMLYQSENLESFFRRLSFSPDGSLLFTPSGIFKDNNIAEENNKEGLTNTIYIYSRQGLNRPPIAHLPGFKKSVLAVSFSPIFYELNEDCNANIFDLPYKMIYALATQDSVFIFDTQSNSAIGSVSSIHYRILTDLSWNSDGDSLMISSADGFCTYIKFKAGELGKKLKVNYTTLIPKSGTETLEETKPKTGKKIETKIDIEASEKKRQGADVLNIISK